MDYKSKNGLSIWNRNTEALDNKYDLNPKELHTFLASFERRATLASWSVTVQVPIANNPGAFQSVNVPKKYGTLSQQEILDYGKVALARQDREAQDSYQMAVFLQNSLTDLALQKVESKSSRYYVDTTPHGLSMLKAIITDAAIDTRYTAIAIKRKIIHAEELMVNCDHNIVQFNTEFRLLEQELVARGGSVDDSDLLFHLSNGYKTSNDTVFSEYFNRIWQQYADGERNLTVNDFMTKMENKYKQRLEDGEWMQPTAQHKQIMALTAQLNQFKQAKKSEGKVSEKKEKHDKAKRDYPAWKKVPPKDGAAQTIKKDGRTYHWCIKHAMWTMHKPSECKLQDHKEEKGKSENKDKLKTDKAIGFLARLKLGEWIEDEEESDEDDDEASK